MKSPLLGASYSLHWYGDSVVFWNEVEGNRAVKVPLESCPSLRIELSALENSIVPSAAILFAPSEDEGEVSGDGVQYRVKVSPVGAPGSLTLIADDESSFPWVKHAIAARQAAARCAEAK
jgi:hypothetical protein